MQVNGDENKERQYQLAWSIDHHLRPPLLSIFSYPSRTPHCLMFNTFFLTQVVCTCVELVIHHKQAYFCFVL